VVWLLPGPRGEERSRWDRLRIRQCVMCALGAHIREGPSHLDEYGAPRTLNALMPGVRYRAAAWPRSGSGTGGSLGRVDPR
jgi:hypothetical protein